jgi:hypothetical protein
MKIARQVSAMPSRYCSTANYHEYFSLLLLAILITPNHAIPFVSFHEKYSNDCHLIDQLILKLRSLGVLSQLINSCGLYRNFNYIIMYLCLYFTNAQPIYSLSKLCWTSWDFQFLLILFSHSAAVEIVTDMYLFTISCEVIGQPHCCNKNLMLMRRVESKEIPAN